MDATTICPRCGGALEIDAARLGADAERFEDCHARCVPCGIGITNEPDPAERSFLRRHWADGLWDPESERELVFVRKGRTLRQSRTKLARFAEERSEDRLLWDVFYALRQGRRLDAAASFLAGREVRAPVRLRVWGHGLDEPDALDEMRSFLVEDVGELPTHLPEFDAMLVSRGDLIFVEADFGSRHPYEVQSPRWDRYAALRTASGQPVFTRDPGDIDPELYPLARAWACGARFTSLRPGAPRFHLVHLAPEGQREDIDRELEPLLDPTVGRYHRASWEALVRAAMPELEARLATVTEFLRPAFSSLAEQR